MENDLITAARGWIGTRFLHQGRRKRGEGDAGGVDCLGLVIGVGVELGCVARDGKPLAKHDQRDYSRQPDPAYLAATLAEVMHAVAADAPIASGQVALFRQDGRVQHLGILAVDADGRPRLIHAYAPARKVVEHGLDAAWRSRMAARFEVARR